MTMLLFVLGGTAGFAAGAAALHAPPEVFSLQTLLTVVFISAVMGLLTATAVTPKNKE